MDVRGWDTGHHPGVVLTEKREQFARLIGQGVSNSEACRLVGVNRKTGTRWRFGRTIANTAGEPVHYPPVTILNATARSLRYLSLSERTTIADLHRDGFSVRARDRACGPKPAGLNAAPRTRAGEHIEREESSS